jgi:hypothetical protein
MDADTLPHAKPTGAKPRTTGRAGQLRLLDVTDRPEWCLDDTTREVGRRGIQAARAALRSSRRPGGDDPSHEHKTSTAA